MTAARDPENPIQRGINRPNHARRQAALMFSKQVVSLRLAGHTFPAIAELLGKPKGSVHRAFVRAFEVHKAQMAEDVADLRALEVARLDRMLSAIAARVEKGDDKAIDRALKIGERRARLLGLDAPLKVAPTDPSGDGTYNPLLAAIAEAARHGHEGLSAPEPAAPAPGGESGGSQSDPDPAKD